MTEREELPEALSRLMTLDEGPGPAEPLDAARSKAVIDAVLDGWAPAAAAGHAARAGRGRGFGWALAAVLFGIGTAAAFYVARQPAAPEAMPPARTPMAAPAPAPVEPEAALPEGEPVQPLEPSEASAAPEPEPAPQPDRVAASRAHRADDLLLQANRLRGEGRYRAAAQRYLEVVRRAPASPAAGVARVAAADIRLEQLGDPRGALSLYRKALSAPGALALEAHAGVARAHRALGDRDAEARALQALLAAHGDGPTADWARARLSSLRGQ